MRRPQQLAELFLKRSWRGEVARRSLIRRGAPRIRIARPCDPPAGGCGCHDALCEKGDFAMRFCSRVTSKQLKCADVTRLDPRASLAARSAQVEPERILRQKPRNGTKSRGHLARKKGGGVRCWSPLRGSGSHSETWRSCLVWRLFDLSLSQGYYINGDHFRLTPLTSLSPRPPQPCSIGE